MCSQYDKIVSIYFLIILFLFLFFSNNTFIFFTTSNSLEEIVWNFYVHTHTHTHRYVSVACIMVEVNAIYKIMRNYTEAEMTK